jgi:hypothetical protein
MSVLESDGFKGQMYLDKKSAKLEQLRIENINLIKQLQIELDQSLKTHTDMKKEIDLLKITLEKYR